MKLTIYNPKQALNKAYLKEKVSRENIELFKKNLITLIGKIDENESEEHLKNVISDFLKDTWYKETNEINTKDRQDLVIHTGKTTKEPVGVILEVKKPSNKTEMMSEAKPNAKAMHELILYYLRERTAHNNIDIKYLIATNIYEWFIIDEVWFEKNVFRNTKLKKDFETWRLSGNDTKFFYENIAKPFLETITEKIECTYFDIRKFVDVISNDDKKDDNKLIALYKILSPVHLLKQPFANDSNSLDTKFYSELLHIIGLEEVKDGGKKLIKRKEKPDVASILENAIMKLEDKDCLRNISNLSSYGSDRNEQLFNVALELSITWINRVLFLKLLEAQLFKYHKGNNDYVFLNHKTIHDFDELGNLFFQVLAERQSKRREHLKEKFKRVPYLNSSLFERTELERQTFDISGLDNNLELKLISSSVLKNEQGKRKSGELTTLQYLFDFLDSYDFTSEGSEEIQEQNKNLINASVLGLIFEKINGYKDGSFFTPSFVTMYMCKESIRKAVVQKFNEKCKIDCETFEDLKNFIASKFKAKDILEFNTVINDLKICDPAVGSGHFLVSALNEVIAIKAELGILADKEGTRLTGYEVKIENDELIITYNNNTEIFEYSVTGNSIAKEVQRVQKTLFHEKESIIENSLFGVDINPNSVKICRLRLWIELLKNAYYTEESKFTELETLPNIDINIKCGNSLISRFPLDADLKKALKGKWNIDTYKIAVHSYHNAENKEEKRKLEELIDTIKKDFKTEIGNNDPRKRKLIKLKEELFLITKPKLELDVEIKKGGKKLEKEKINKITSDINIIEEVLKNLENNKLFDNAFEWRFEFPEVLNNDGEYVGFDIVIGNPPYFSLSKIKEQSNYFESAGYLTYSKGADIYCLFYERGNQILKSNGILTFITSNSWLRAIYGELLKNYFTIQMQPIDLLNIEDTQIFDEATVESNILSLRKGNRSLPFRVCQMTEDYFIGSSLSEYFNKNSFEFDLLQSPDWIFGNIETGSLKQKIEIGSKILKDFDVTINFGIKTGYNAAFIIDEQIKKKLVAENPKSIEIIKPILRGRDLEKYNFNFQNFYLINSHNGLKRKNIERINVEKDYPNVYEYLSSFLPKVEERQDQGEHWSNLRNCAYLEDFQKPKIVWGEISDKPKFAFDDSNYFAEATTFLMTGKNLKYLLAILNSKVSEWYFNQISTTTGMGTNRWKKYKIELLPIKDISEKQQEPIVKLVDKILIANKSSEDTTELENKIDELVYKLYDLNEDEIKIVESK